MSPGDPADTLTHPNETDETNENRTGHWTCEEDPARGGTGARSRGV